MLRRKRNGTMWGFRERPGSEEQKELDKQKVPLLLNFSQCQLLKEEWYQVIQHTTDVLNIDPGEWSRQFY